MITRRDFFKYAVASGALASVGFTKEAKAGLKQVLPNSHLCFESERAIPIYKNVDIVVVGGSARAVEAAVAAARNGASVFLIAQLPYLGDEICGTLAMYEGLNQTPRNISMHYFYGLEGSLKTSLSVKMLRDTPAPPTPLHIKTVLENELIDTDVDFLYSSLPTNLIVDNKGVVSGVVFVSRSGRQAIKAKQVIDATPTAELAKMAGAKIQMDESLRTDFHFRVVGNTVEKKGEISNLQILPYQVKFAGKNYPVTRVTLTTEFKMADYGALMEIEQQLRDNTFDPDQVSSSDLLEFTPPYKIICETSAGDLSNGIRHLPLSAYQPKGVKGIVLLNQCIDCSEKGREKLSLTEMMLMGEMLGSYVSANCKTESLASAVMVKVNAQLGDNFGNVNEVLTPLRTNLSNASVISSKEALPVLGHYDIVVLGGGTAGAPAAISATEHGAKTLVLEYLHGFGGTGTFGMIGRYWDGYREGYTAYVDKGVRDIAPLNHPRQMKNWNGEWNFDWKIEWYRRQMREKKTEIWFGVIGCGAVVKNNKVEGLVVATPYGRGVILCDILIDSTGSADIAIAAGSGYNFIDKNSPAVQGAGLPKVDPGDHYNNTDWAFIDDTDVVDVTRVFIQGKQKYVGSYDMGKLPQTRERRRIVGEYEVSTYDVINHRTYSDTISYHKSSFDTHGITINPLFTLSPPEREHMIYEADVPLRSLLPKGLDGIIVTGLGACADRDAMPVIRMQPCLQNQGYSVGYLAATAIKEKKSIRKVDIKKIQKYLVSIGNLPERVLKENNFKDFSDRELTVIAANVSNNFKGLEKLLTRPNKTIQLIEQQIKNSNDPATLLKYASITSILGSGINASILSDHLNSLKEWDKGWHYTGMGQFGECMSRMDSYIMALGNSKRVDLLDTVISKAVMLTAASEYSHIRAVSEAFEALGDPRAVEVLYQLLHEVGMRYHTLPNYKTARYQTIPGKIDVLMRNKALKELTLARAIYTCGDKEELGRHILEHYANGLERIYERYAKIRLKAN